MMGLWRAFTRHRPAKKAGLSTGSDNGWRAGCTDLPVGIPQRSTAVLSAEPKEGGAGHRLSKYRTPQSGHPPGRGSKRRRGSGQQDRKDRGPPWLMPGNGVLCPLLKHSPVSREQEYICIARG